MWGFNFIVIKIGVMDMPPLFLTALRYFCAAPATGTGGCVRRTLSVHAFNLIPGRKTFAGLVVGGIPKALEILDFCADKAHYADIDQINDAYERMRKSDVRYRLSST